METAGITAEQADKSVNREQAVAQTDACEDAGSAASGASAIPKGSRHETGAWYAVQVSTGHEERARDLIEEADEFDAFDEVFVPRTNVGKYDQQRGEWIQLERVMFPGYLIAVSRQRNSKNMDRALSRVKTFTRVLGNETGAVRLSDDEVAFLDAYTKRGHRVIPMSEGYITEGGHIVVTEGPLVGQEVLIVKVKHRQKRAVIRMKFCNREKETEVGLHLVRGRRA